MIKRVMADDSTKHAAARKRDVSEAYECCYWSEKFGVSPDELKQAVQAAGPVVEDVAEQGFPPAEFVLGTIYESGKIGPRDRSSALKWFIRAAQQGHVGSKLAAERLRQQERDQLERESVLREAQRVGATVFSVDTVGPKESRPTPIPSVSPAENEAEHEFKRAWRFSMDSGCR